MFGMVVREHALFSPPNTILLVEIVSSHIAAISLVIEKGRQPYHTGLIVH